MCSHMFATRRYRYNLVYNIYIISSRATIRNGVDALYCRETATSTKKPVNDLVSMLQPAGPKIVPTEMLMCTHICSAIMRLYAYSVAATIQREIPHRYAFFAPSSDTSCVTPSLINSY